jgi:hypothetical protein
LLRFDKRYEVDRRHLCKCVTFTLRVVDVAVCCCIARHDAAISARRLALATGCTRARRVCAHTGRIGGHGDTAARWRHAIGTERRCARRGGACGDALAAAAVGALRCRSRRDRVATVGDAVRHRRHAQRVRDGVVRRTCHSRACHREHERCIAARSTTA